MPRPICSVVIPTFNTLDYLPAALASVVAQNLAGVEILVLDDGSSDGTDVWLTENAEWIPGLRVFQGGGLGPARARNLLIKKANSDLVAFLDADDVWWPGKLSAEIDFHRRSPDVALSFTDYLHADPFGRLYGTAFDYWKPAFVDRSRDGFQRIGNPLDSLLTVNAVGTSCAVAKRESLQNANGFSESLPSAEDWDLWLRLAEKGGVAVNPAVTMTYLMRPGSETSNRDARISAMRSIIDRYDGSDTSRVAMRMARARLCSAEAENATSKQDTVGALRKSLQALAFSPSKRNARAAAVSVPRAVSAAIRGVRATTNDAVTSAAGTLEKG